MADQMDAKECFEAAKRNDFDAVQDYLEIILEAKQQQGVDPKAVINEIVEPGTVQNLLHVACMQGNLNACKYLFMCGLYLNGPDAFGRTPLFYASHHGSEALVKWMVSNGADIDTDYSDQARLQQDPKDQAFDGMALTTPLQAAAFGGHEEIVSFLVECNADLSGTKANGISPLHVACFKNHRKIVKLLMEAGADVNARDQNGRTPSNLAPDDMLPLLSRSKLSQQEDTTNDSDSSSLSGGEMEQEEDDHAFSQRKDDALPSNVSMETVRKAYNPELVHGFFAKDWRTRLNAVQQAATNYDTISKQSTPLKAFDASCQVLINLVNDNVSQVFLACSGLLRATFNQMVAGSSSSSSSTSSVFHQDQFHEDRSELQTLVDCYLTRASGSNEKDASEAVSCLLFLVCKSIHLTRYLTSRLLDQFGASSSASSSPATATTPNPNASSSSSSSSTTGTWRHQLVGIKLLNAIASQYRFDTSSGFGFPEAIRMSAVALENPSIHVRTAAIDLFVQSVLFQCEQQELSGSPEAQVDQAKRFADSILQQQKLQLKPSIQAKVNNGLRSALLSSKRLSATTAQGEEKSSNKNSTAPASASSGGVAMVGLESLKLPIQNLRLESSTYEGATGLGGGGLGAAMTTSRGASATGGAICSRGKEEQDLPYAEPLAEQLRAENALVEQFFGERITRCLFSNAWAPRVEALSLLQQKLEIHQLELHLDDSKASKAFDTWQVFQKILQHSLHDPVNAVFEAAIALLMEFVIVANGLLSNFSSATAIGTIQQMQSFLRPLIPRILARIGDCKARLPVVCEDALLLIARQRNAGAAFVLDQILAADRTGATPNSSVYVLNKLSIISKMLLEFGVKESAESSAASKESRDNEMRLSVKSVVQPALQVCEHKEQEVRNMSLDILSEALRLARNATMPFLNTVARSTKQKLISKLVERGVLESDLLMDEVDDFDAIDHAVRPTTAARSGTSSGVRPPTASASSTKHRPALSNTSISLMPPSSSACSSVTPSGSLMAGASASFASSSSPGSPLPYGTALTCEQKAQHSSILELFGEDLVRCLLDKAWAQREAAIRHVERLIFVCSSNSRRQDGAPAPAPAPAPTPAPAPSESQPPAGLVPNQVTLEQLVRVLAIALNDTVVRVYQCALRLLQVVASEFIPIVDSSLDESQLGDLLKDVIEIVVSKLGDSNQRLRMDSFTVLQTLSLLPHFGIALMAQFLCQSFPALNASSPTGTEQCLRLLKALLKEIRSNGHGAAKMVPQLQAILGLLGQAFENKHVDIRNEAVETYLVVYELSHGGTNAAFGELDLNGCLAQVKPGIRETISRGIVALRKGVTATSEELVASPAKPTSESARQSLSLDLPKLKSFFTQEITELLCSSSSQQRCDGIQKIMDALLGSATNVKWKGVWEIACLLCKQLFLDPSAKVCRMGLQLFELLVDPPAPIVVPMASRKRFDSTNTGESASMAAEYGIPWNDWGVQLILSSTIRGVVQQAGNEAVRVRQRVKQVLLTTARKNLTGRHVVSNAVLSEPEQRDPSNETKRSRAIASCRLRWQIMMRIEVLYELIQDLEAKQANGTEQREDRPVSGSAGGSAMLGGTCRYRGSNATTSSSELASDQSIASQRRTSSSKRGETIVLTVENIVPFLGSCLSHPSASVVKSCRMIWEYLRQQKGSEYVSRVQGECSTQLQKRLVCLSEEPVEEPRTANHFREGDVTCVKGSRASHIRRVAALRPPRTVPVPEKKNLYSTPMPPHSAPGNENKALGDADTFDVEDTEEQNCNDLIAGNDDDKSRAKRPIWLEPTRGKDNPIPSKALTDLNSSSAAAAASSTTTTAAHLRFFPPDPKHCEEPQEDLTSIKSSIGAGYGAMDPDKDRSSNSSKGKRPSILRNCGA